MRANPSIHERALERFFGAAVGAAWTGASSSGVSVFAVARVARGALGSEGTASFVSRLLLPFGASTSTSIDSSSRGGTKGRGACLAEPSPTGASKPPGEVLAITSEMPGPSLSASLRFAALLSATRTSLAKAEAAASASDEGTAATSPGLDPNTERGGALLLLPGGLEALGAGPGFEARGGGGGALATGFAGGGFGAVFGGAGGCFDSTFGASTFAGSTFFGGGGGGELRGFSLPSTGAEGKGATAAEADVAIAPAGVPSVASGGIGETSTGASGAADSAPAFALAWASSLVSSERTTVASFSETEASGG